MSGRWWSGPEITQDWHDARQLLADAGMGDMSVAAAIATLLPAPVDEDELAASMARHPSARRRGHTITWTIDCPPDPTASAGFWQRIKGAL